MLIVLQPPLWGPVLPLHGILIAVLFTLQHECTQRTHFASDRLCDDLGQGLGVVILNPFVWFRHFHFAHHRHTNRAGDPELDGPPLQTRAHWPWHVSGSPHWHAQIADPPRAGPGDPGVVSRGPSSWRAACDGCAGTA